VSDDGPRARVGVALVVAVVAISFAAIFFRKAAPTHPLVTSGGRLIVAALVLLPFVVRAARAGRLPRGTVGAAALGGIAYAVHFGTWVTSLGLTTVAASVTLVTATPLLLAVVALVTRRDEPDRRHWVAIGLALLGLGLIGGADFWSAAALAGDGLAFLGAAAMAAYLLLVRRQGKGLDVAAFTGIATAVGGACLLLAAVVAGVPIAFPSDEAFLFVVLSALVPQLVGHTLLTWALGHTRPTVVGLATVGEPVGSTLLGWLWLAEIPPAVTLLGCAVTVLAVGISITGGPGPPRPPGGMTES